MAQFSSMVEGVIGDFAQSLGLTAARASDGSYSFRFDSGDVLSFTPSVDSERLLLSITFRSDRGGDQAEKLLLSVAGFDPTADVFTHSGLASDGSMVIARAFPASEVNLPLIDMNYQALKSIRGAVN